MTALDSAAVVKPITSEASADIAAAPAVVAAQREAELDVERAVDVLALQTKPALAAPNNDQIIGAPVVGIATGQAATPRLIKCSRCHGHSAEGMRFCKYCGAPLDEIAAQQRVDAEVHAADAFTARTASETFSSRTSERNTQRVERANIGFASPAAASVATNTTPTSRLPRGRLVVIVEDGSEGKSFPLEDRQVDVGRTEGDILLPDDHYVSPRHARLLPEAGRWVVRDLASTNGVYRRIRDPHTLKDGDLLLLGLEVLQFETVNDAERGLGHASQHGTLLFGSPSTSRRARLCQRTVEGVTRDVYHLFRDETVIGREVGDIVFTADPFLSRRHAAIRRSPGSGEFAITDLDSSNGTYVAIRSDKTLANGDYLRIGQHLFRVDLV